MQILKKKPAASKLAPHHHRPDAAARRREMQAEIARKDELQAELKDLLEQQSALQERVDAGELTPAAMRDVRRKIARLGDRLSNIGNRFRSELLASAPEDLKVEFGDALERKRKAIARREAAKRELEKIVPLHDDRVRHYADVCRRQEAPGAARWSEDEHQHAQREIASLQRERDVATDELAASERQLERMTDALEEVRSRCIRA